jgi:hypothetical protein
MDAGTTRNDGEGVMPMSGEDYSWLFRRLDRGSPTIDEIARQRGVRPVESVDDARADIWESDEELDAFLADVRASRDANLA